jgi:hypothetical protein
VLSRYDPAEACESAEHEQGERDAHEFVAHAPVSAAWLPS